MSNDLGHDTPGATSVASTAASTPAAPSATATTNATAPTTEALPNLMAAGAAPARGLDLDVEALRVAQQAIIDGERVLAAAREQLRLPAEPPTARRRRRDLAIALMIGVNLVAMIALAMLPPATVTTVTTAPPKAPLTAPTPTAPVAPPSDPTVRRFHEPFQQALAAADRADYATAITTLERYLADTPSLQPSQQLNVLNMLSHYASLANDFKKAQDFAQRAAAIGQSHSLPADLVAMAKAAAESGDQETLRRVWARFLLQRRQIPSWLYKHVAEAYLQLGDSYRSQANAASEGERARLLQEAADQLKQQSAAGAEAGK
ncbi:MAG: hypothetical protein FJ301_09225 [Planctomycetes bacterium]|nr:hypothetical protein [Planctomycetota bacterium]